MSVTVLVITAHKIRIRMIVLFCPYRNGSRYSAARAFVRPVTHRENLHVLLNAHVARVVINPATKKVTGVEYIKDGEKKTVGVKREVLSIFGPLSI